LRVTQKRGWVGLTDDLNIAVEQLAHTMCDSLGAQRLGSCEVAREHLGRSVTEASQREFVGIPLPAHVDVRGLDRDWFARTHCRPDVSKDSVAQVHGVVQPDERDGGATGIGCELEYPFAAETGLGVLSDRCWWCGLRGTTSGGRDERVHVPGG